jgi:hypothetical protein
MWIFSHRKARCIAHETLPALSFLIYDLDSTLPASLWKLRKLREGKNHKVKKEESLRGGR